MVVIDLFSGAGGLTEGFLKEGFDVVAHVEKDKWACETLKTRIMYYYLKKVNDIELYNLYLSNCRGYKFIDEDRKMIFDQYPRLKEKLDIEVINKAFGDVEKETDATSTKEMIELIEKAMKYNGKEHVDLIIGGPPCQAYSIVGRGRMKEAAREDKRNFLFRYYKEMVSHFKPSMFVFENVPGMLTARNGEIFKKIVHEFRKIGYKVVCGNEKDNKKNVLNAYDFGVHQNRQRLILFGFKPSLDLGYPDFLKHKFVFTELNTLNAIGDLPALYPGYGCDYSLLPYGSKENIQLSEFQKLMREGSIGVINHRARSNQDRDLRIYKNAILLARQGKQLKYTDIPKEDRTHQNEQSFLDRFKVHGWENVPHTIVAHISKDGHYNIHPDEEQCRSLTVREAARIQSFPDNYKFEGPRTAQFVQVGNAVPPLMAQVIAKTIKEIIADKINLT